MQIMENLIEIKIQLIELIDSAVSRPLQTFLKPGGKIRPREGNRSE